MSEAKFTPGPWGLETPFGAPGMFVTVAGPRRTNPIICHVYPGDDEQRSPERLANARLIAAAPEMYQALQECLTSEGALCWTSREYAEKRIRYMDRIARAALAKAEGREG